MGAPKKVAIDKCVGARTGVTRSQCDDMGFQAVAQRMTENPGRMRAYVKAHPKSRAAASGWVQGQYWVIAVRVTGPFVILAPGVASAA